MKPSEPFVPRSFIVRSPRGHERVYTTMPHNRLLLTAEGTTTELKKEKEVLMGVQLDDSSYIRIGTPLLALGIPLFGMVTGLFPLPSVDGKFRLLVNYLPLPKPNIQKAAQGIDSGG